MVICKQWRHLFELRWTVTTWPSSAADSHKPTSRTADLCTPVSDSMCKIHTSTHLSIARRHIVGQLMFAMWSKIDVPSTAVSKRSNTLVSLDSAHRQHILQQLRTAPMLLTTRWPTIWRRRRRPQRLGLIANDTVILCIGYTTASLSTAPIKVLLQ